MHMRSNSDSLRRTNKDITPTLRVLDVALEPFGRILDAQKKYRKKLGVKIAERPTY